MIDPRLFTRAQDGTYTAAVMAGVVGALMVTVVSWVFRWLAGIPVNLELLLGTWTTADTRESAWTIGFVWHLVNGGVFGWLYGFLFRVVGETGMKSGAVIGLFHWVSVSLLIGILPWFHPLLVSYADGPGFFYLNGGIMAALEFLVLHLAFGVLLGAAFQRSAERNALMFGPDATSDRYDRAA